jgi:hypothetical protein
MAMKAKIIGKGIMQPFSKDITFSTQIRVQDLPRLLEMPQDLANNLIVVRNHQNILSDETIENGDEIYLFIAAMGG